MTEARYAVVRYIADPARNEAFNIGVVGWSPHDVVVRIDDVAVARVVRENPNLERDALLGVEHIISTTLDSAGEVDAALRLQKGFPVSFTEARLTTVTDGTTLGETVDRLITRIVTPPRRRGGAGASPADAVRRALRAVPRRHEVVRKYPVETSASGTPRVVDFFLNHGTNRALDVVGLAVSKAEEIRRRADAEAFKVWDITQTNKVEFIVLCALSDNKKLNEVNDIAIRTIEAGGARVFTEADHAVRALVGQEPLL